MLTWMTALPLAAVAMLIGYGVGHMPCWSAWQGYTGLVIVATLAIAAGVPTIEICIDCTGFGVGFTIARR